MTMAPQTTIPADVRKVRMPARYRQQTYPTIRQWHGYRYEDGPLRIGSADQIQSGKRGRGGGRNKDRGGESDPWGSDALTGGCQDESAQPELCQTDGSGCGKETISDTNVSVAVRVNPGIAK